MNESSPYDAQDVAVVIKALETLAERHAEHIAQLKRNDILPMFRDMDEDQFAQFMALNVPALMAWCARNTLPHGASFNARHMRSRLCEHDALERFIATAANDVLLPAAASRAVMPGYRARNHARNPVFFDRLTRFLEQIERTAAFPPELSRSRFHLLDSEDEADAALTCEK